MKLVKRRTTAAVLVGFLAFLGTSKAHAQYTWNLNANGTWDTVASNWLLAGTPAAWSNGANSATFGNVATASRTIAIAAGGVTAGQINFDNTGPFFYTVGTSGNNITLNNGGSDAAINVSGGSVGTGSYAGTGGHTITGSNITFFNNLNLANNGAFGTTALTMAGNIDRNVAGGQIVASGQGTTAISGIIGATVTGGIVKNGAGQLVLSNTSNAFSGGVTINGGVVTVTGTADSQLGNAANQVTINGGGVFRAIVSGTFTTARQFNITGTAGTPSGIDLNGVTTMLSNATNGLSGSGVLNLTSNLGGTLSVEGVNNGFTGSINIGSPLQLTGHVPTPRPFSSSNLTTLRLQNAGTLANATSITIQNGSALTITQQTTGTVTTGRLGITAPLTFHSGRFQYNTGANGGTAISETFGNVEATGVLTITGSAAAGPTNGTTLSFGALTRTDNAMLLFRGPATGTGSIGGSATGTRYFFSNLVADTVSSGTTRSVVAWAGNATTTSSADPQNFMTYDANGFRPLNTTTEVVTLSTSNTLAAAASGVNIRTTSATQAIKAGGQTINSYSSSTTTAITAASASDTLTNTSGAWATFNTFTFSNGTINNPNGAYFHLGFPFAFTGTSSLTGANGVTVGSLGASSSYQLRFSNTVANTFTGGLFAQGNATVTFTANNQLGLDGGGFQAGAITLGGGQLIYNPAAAATIALTDSGNNRNISVNASGGTIGTGLSNAVLQIAGGISGAGQVQFGGGTTSSATGVVELTNTGANSYTGGTLISTGILRISNVNQLGTGGVYLNGGTLQASAGLTFGSAPIVTASSTIDTQANNVSLAGIRGSGGSTGSAATTHVLTKSGTGTMTVNAAGNYAGTLVLSAVGGSLTFNANGRLPELGAITLNRSTTLNVDNSGTNLSDRTGRATNVTMANGGVAGGANMNLTTNGAGSSFTFGSLTVSGGIAGNVNTSNLTIIDGGVGDNSIYFESLTAIANNNLLNFLGSANFGSNVATGTHLFFRTAPTLTLGVIANTTFTGFGGSGQATYDPTFGVVLYTPPTPTSGTFIDNTANVGAGSITSTNALFTTTGDTTANIGAKINSLTLDLGNNVNLVQLRAAQGANANTPIDTLLLSSGQLTSQNGAKSITASTTGKVSFAAVLASITTTSDLTIGSGVTMLGTGGLSKAGAGNLIFGAGSTNSISGDYNITAGSLTLNGSASVGSLTSTAGTVLDLGGGTFTTTTASSTAAAGNIVSATGVLQKAGAGVLTLSGTNTFGGGLQVTGGTVAVGNLATNVGTGTVTLNGGALRYTGATATSPGTLAISLGASGGTVDISTTATTLTHNQAMTGVGDLIKIGTGTLALGAPQSYGGSTIVRAGVLTQTVANALPTATALTIGNTLASDNTAVFNLGGFDATVASLTFAAKSSSGAAAQLVLGGNTLFVNGNISMADCAANPGNNFPVTISSTAGGKIDLGGQVRNLNVAGNNNSSDLTIGAEIANGGVNYTGTPSVSNAAAAVVTYSVNNTYSGGTTVNRGTLAVSSGVTMAGATGGLTVNTSGGFASLLTLNSAQTVGSLSGTASGAGTATINLAAAAATLTVNQSANTSYAGIISGSGGLTKQGAGTLILTGANTFTGAIAISGGTLRVNGAGVIADSVNAVTVASGAALGGTGTINRAITIASGAYLTPGASIGKLTVATNRTTTIGGNSNLVFEYNSDLPGIPVAGVDNDFMSGALATLDLSGLDTGANKWNVFLSPSTYTPVNTPVPQVFTAFTYASITNPTGIVAGDLTPFINFMGAYLGTATASISGGNVFFSFTPVPEPGAIFAFAAIAAAGVVAIRRKIRKM